MSSSSLVRDGLYQDYPLSPTQIKKNSYMFIGDGWMKGDQWIGASSAVMRAWVFCGEEVEPKGKVLDLLVHLQSNLPVWS